MFPAVDTLSAHGQIITFSYFLFDIIVTVKLILLSLTIITFPQVCCQGYRQVGQVRGSLDLLLSCGAPSPIPALLNFTQPYNALLCLALSCPAHNAMPFPVPAPLCPSINISSLLFSFPLLLLLTSHFGVFLIVSYLSSSPAPHRLLLPSLVFS